MVEAGAALRDRQDKASQRLMWITPDRVFYVGLLGAPSVRTMGCIILYVAVEGAIRIRIDGGEWQTGSMAVVPPYLPHQVVSESRIIHAIKLESESVDLEALPPMLRASGAVHEPEFVEHVRRCRDQLCGADVELKSADFDRMFFGTSLARRALDRRINAAVERIKQNPSAPISAEDCADAAHLSFSRFLHLFKQDVGVPFRSFRTWKRARSLLHYVNRPSNLAQVALDVGYPDSTHFSHSIRNVYGLTPKDIFAGSRRLPIYAQFGPSA